MAAQISIGTVGSRRCAWEACPNEQTPDMTLRRCSHCRASLYCGTNCQRGDWGKHQIVCLSKHAEASSEPQPIHLLDFVRTISALREASKAPFQVLLPLIIKMSLLSKGSPEAKEFSDILMKQALECVKEGNHLTAELDALEKGVKDRLEGIGNGEASEGVTMRNSIKGSLGEMKEGFAFLAMKVCLINSKVLEFEKRG